MVNPTVLKAAQEYVEKAFKSNDVDWHPLRAFIEGDAHGYARSVRMLRDDDLTFKPRHELNCPEEWANWLEEIEKREK